MPWIAIGLVVLAAVAGLFLWLSEGNTIKLTKAERVVADNAAAETLTNEQLEGIAPAGIAEYYRLTGENANSATPAVAPAGLKPGSWTKTQPVENGYGPILIKYTEAASAKGKVIVWVEGNEAGWNVKNITAKNITFTALEKLVVDGKVVSDTNRSYDVSPGKTFSTGFANIKGPQTFEFRVEVR